MRILLLTNMWPTTADPVFGVFVARHVAALRALGADVLVVSNSDSRTGRLRAALKYGSLALRAWFAARPGRYDVVVGHYLYPTAGFAMHAARRARVPLVLVAHGTDARSVQRDDRFGRRGREALASAALVVAVSEAVERTLRADVGLTDDVPTAVINMGFDHAVFFPNPVARDKLRLAEERVVLFAGNLTHGKGVDVLVEAFVRLLDSGKADRLVLVGGGPEESALRRRLRERASDSAHTDAADRVLFTGRLAGSDLALWANAADVFVLPSRAEGLGLVLLEAMACGTPCVGSDTGGIPEILAVPSCGRLVPPGDVDALAAAVAEVLDSGKDSFAEACVARASAHTSSAKAEEFLNRIERVVDRG